MLFKQYRLPLPNNIFLVTHSYIYNNAHITYRLHYTHEQSGCSVTGLYQQNAQGTHTLLNRTPYTPKPHPYTPKLHPYTPKPHTVTLRYYSSWAYAIGGAFDFYGLCVYIYNACICFLTLYSRCCNRPYNIQESIKLWIYESPFPFPHIL